MHTKLAEELGFYSATLPTHMTLPPGWLFDTFTNDDCLDALVIAPAIAAATSRLKIGFNSILLPVLPPYQWAKYLSTLDVMSDGRLIVGAAMGWWEEDFTAVGVDRRKRGRLFDEQLETLDAGFGGTGATVSNVESVAMEGGVSTNVYSGGTTLPALER